jgi:hypothetical protein
MKRRVTKCLLLMQERDQTNEAVLTRLRAIEANMRKCSGAMRRLTSQRIAINQDYWTAWINGYGDHLLTLSNEMTLIRTLLAKRL